MDVEAIEYEGNKERLLSTMGTGETMAAVMARRFSRRALVAGVAGTAVIAVGPSRARSPARSHPQVPRRLPEARASLSTP